MLNPSPACGRGRGPSRQRWEGEGWPGLQRIENEISHARRVSRHIIVPHANDAPSVALQPFRSPRIRSAVEVLASVHFDDEAMPDRDKVSDIGADRALPAEFVAFEPAVPQDQPQATLGIRLISPKTAGGFADHSTPHPSRCARHPLPQAGEGFLLRPPRLPCGKSSPIPCRSPDTPRGGTGGGGRSRRARAFPSSRSGSPAS